MRLTLKIAGKMVGLARKVSHRVDVILLVVRRIDQEAPSRTPRWVHADNQGLVKTVDARPGLLHRACLDKEVASLGLGDALAARPGCSDGERGTENEANAGCHTSLPPSCFAASLAAAQRTGH